MNLFPRCLFSALLVVSGVVHAADATRPNILFVFADDWGRYASAYAKVDGKPSINDVIKTPNCDRVAKEGVIFRNAFVNAPSCTPCRSALLSGQYFFRTGRGAILQGATWDTAIPSFPLLLRDEGYAIGKTSKVWSPGSPSDAPFGGQDYNFAKGMQQNNFSENVTKMVEGGMALEAARQKILDEVRGTFDLFLQSRKGQEAKPWLFWFGTTTTHRAWVKGSGKKLWGIEPEDLKGKMPAFLPDVPEVREDVADYLGEAQAVDAYVGVLLKRLEEIGELDKTLIVLSGDHGMPGFTNGKCNLYDNGVAVSLIARVPGGKGGRVVDDLVNLMDLCPTFCEAGGVKPPAVMTGRSLWKVLHSDKSGQVDETRTFNVSGRERHVAGARENNLPYPQRCYRTKDFLYIRNFEPDRWPMGSPYQVTDSATPDAAALESNTFAAFPDMDASPTKAWLVAHRNEAQWKQHYDWAFAKRPGEELYDLSKDPDQVKNVADDPAYAEKKKELSGKLMRVLTEAEDPRVTEGGKMFENPPFTDADNRRQEAKGKGKGKGKKKQ
jgi:N-sulfoglucosamine sulfohydrolase